MGSHFSSGWNIRFQAVSFEILEANFVLFLLCFLCPSCAGELVWHIALIYQIGVDTWLKLNTPLISMTAPQHLAYCFPKLNVTNRCDPTFEYKCPGTFFMFFYSSTYVHLTIGLNKRPNCFLNCFSGKTQWTFRLWARLKNYIYVENILQEQYESRLK